MRILLCLTLGALASPALANPSLQIVASSSDAQVHADSLTAALRAALSPGGERDDCPLVLSDTGELRAVVAQNPGPPPGWKLSLGREDGMLDAASGVAGDVSAGAQFILDSLCPRGDDDAPGPWTASGGGNGTVVTGTVASVSQMFSLECSFPGGTCVFDYVPFGNGGIVDGSLSGSGVTATVDGFYLLRRLPGDVYVIEQTTSGCVDGIPNSCRTNDHTITLTPAGN